VYTKELSVLELSINNKEIGNECRENRDRERVNKFLRYTN